MKELTNPHFDNTLISDDDAKKLLYYEGQIGRSRKRVADEILTFGKILHEVQSLLSSYSGGVFVAWLDSIGVSKSSAYRYIDAHVNFGSFPTVGNLEVGAMYVLTSNEAAKKKALKLAEKGVKVSQSMAKTLVDQCSEKPKLDIPKSPIIDIATELPHNKMSPNKFDDWLRDEVERMTERDDDDEWEYVEKDESEPLEEGEIDCGPVVDWEKTKRKAKATAEALIRVIDDVKRDNPKWANHATALKLAQDCWKLL